MIVQQLDFNPPPMAISGRGGNDIWYEAEFPFDTETATHELRIAETEDGIAIETLTSQNGLTVTEGETTTVLIQIPAEFTLAHRGEKLWFDYTIDGFEDRRLTYMAGTITISKGILADPEPDP